MFLMGSVPTLQSRHIIAPRLFETLQKYRFFKLPKWTCTCIAMNWFTCALTRGIINSPYLYPSRHHLRANSRPTTSIHHRSIPVSIWMFRSTVLNLHRYTYSTYHHASRATHPIQPPTPPTCSLLNTCTTLLLRSCRSLRTPLSPIHWPARLPDHPLHRRQRGPISHGAVAQAGNQARGNRVRI